jgi:hypothetical protein
MDPNIPPPEWVLGHAIGERAARYDAIRDYVLRLADSSPLITVTQYAITHEGRPLLYVTITSEENHARLDQIRIDAGKLADPRSIANDAEAEAIIERTPAIAWLAYAIHGDEMSPADAALQVMYRLVAGTDEATVALRDRLVINIDPLQNADGRERYLAQLQTLQGRVPNPDYQAMQHAGLWSAGRGNHYLFDLNRDWLPQVHPETRGRAAAILQWNPHFLIDGHEMSGLDTYLFDPPREPINRALADDVLRWRRFFSAEQAGALDQFGWSYYTREWYEEWYPGYTNAWAGLLGIIGMLYEAPSLNGAEVRQASGEIVPYRHAVRVNVVGSLRNLRTLAEHRESILRDYLADRRWAVTADEPWGGTFLLPPASDRARRERLLDLLDRQGIEYVESAGPVEAEQVVDVFGAEAAQRTFPAGTVVVSSRQPHRRLMHAMLDFDPRMKDEFVLEERTELERDRGSKLYDNTAWNLAMAYGVEAAWATSVGDFEARASLEPETPFVPDASYGYVLDGADADIAVALVRLFDAGCKPRLASKPFSASGRDYEPGAILLRGHENPADLRELVIASVDGLRVDVRAADSALSMGGPDLGGQRMHLLHAPRVAIASQWPVSTTSFGATWFLLDQRLELRASPINVQRLGSIDLRQYNVLILPSASSGGLGAVLDESTVGRLRRWVQAGGTLIAYSGSASVLAREEGMSSVRRRRDVLDELEPYAEAVRREAEARDISIDLESLWSVTPPDEGDDLEEDADEPDDDDEKDDDEKDDEGKDDELEGDALERQDRWSRRFSPAGVFVSAHANTEHWLAFGVDARLPVMVSGSTVLLSKPPVQTAVRLNGAETLRLSGLLWPEARERLAHSAYCTRESMGNGQIILFANDPFFRGYMEGSGRVLLNAILYGPGMGADQTMPW